VNDVSQVSLVKMDIEGAEFMVLPSLIPFLKKTRPALYLSTHAPLLSEAERQERMAHLADLLSFYPSCRNSNGDETGVRALTAPASLSGFQSFVLSG
jgi:hypothetical protein